jgi:hypothetical protein
MNAERGWIASPQPKVEWHQSHYSREAERIAARVEEWAAHHRGQGHHPHPAPTQENPERWDCECGYIWRNPDGRAAPAEVRTFEEASHSPARSQIASTAGAHR